MQRTASLLPRALGAVGILLGLWGCDDAVTSRLARKLSSGSEQDAQEPTRGTYKQRMGTIALRTEIRAEPRADSAVVGALVAGNLVPRSPEPVGRDGCPEGWYAVEPRGYLCLDKRTTLDENHPTLQVRSMAANRTNSLPYPYAITRHDTSLYELDPKRRDGVREQRRLGKGSVFAVIGSWETLDEFDQKQRLAMLTTGGFVPVKDIEPTRFGPTWLTAVGSGEARFPFAFVTEKDASSYRLNHGKAEATTKLAKRTLSLTGSSRVIEKDRYWAWSTEDYVRESDVVVLRKRQDFPSSITKSTHVVDLDLARGTLVLYEGTTPLYATIALRGPRREPKAEVAHVAAKYVTLPPDSQNRKVSSERLDLAWVVDLDNGLRFAAASKPNPNGDFNAEGVIELHPEDARQVFQWLLPEVPERWHGVVTNRSERQASSILLH
ncbi:MAG: hypothetical protein QM784_03560 [Polyangiaceae bacterium]